MSLFLSQSHTIGKVGGFAKRHRPAAPAKSGFQGRNQASGCCRPLMQNLLYPTGWVPEKAPFSSIDTLCDYIATHVPFEVGYEVEQWLSLDASSHTHHWFPSHINYFTLAYFSKSPFLSWSTATTYIARPHQILPNLLYFQRIQLHHCSR